MLFRDATLHMCFIHVWYMWHFHITIVCIEKRMTFHPSDTLSSAIFFWEVKIKYKITVPFYYETVTVSGSLERLSLGFFCLKIIIIFYKNTYNLTFFLKNEEKWHSNSEEWDETVETLYDGALILNCMHVLKSYETNSFIIT